MTSELQKFENDDLIKWITVDAEEDNALYGAYRRDYVKLLRARRKKVELLRPLEKGGRAKKQVARHDEFHRRILADYFETPAFTADGIVHEARLPFSGSQNFRGAFE